MTELRIADDFALPLDLVVQKTAILARSGAGKTNTAVVIAEEILDAGQQLVILDPPGAWWGLRSSVDGAAAGYPIVVLGGEHGDLPLESGAGEVVADFVVDHRASVILDLSDFSLAQVANFATAFGQRLYTRKSRDRTPMLLVIEEADELAPQNVRSEQAQMVGAYERIVKRGRMRGIGTLLISQRSASLNKHLLSQIGTLIALQTTDPRDIKAIDEWVERQGDEERRRQMLAELASLPIGTGFVWSPAWLGIFRKVAFRRRRTFDSSATPEVGQVVRAPERLADVDLDVLKGKLAATIEKAAADDPKALRAQIADLQRLLRAKPTAAALKVERVVETVVERVEVPVLTDEQIARLVEATDAARSVAMRLIDAADSVTRSLVDARPLPRPSAAPARKLDRAIEFSGASESPRSVKRPADDSARHNTTSAEVLSKGARGLIEELARRHPMRVTRTQLATLAGRGAKSSSYDQQLAELRRRELVEMSEGKYSITAVGLDLVGTDVTRPRTSEEVIETWRRALPDGARRLFDVLVALRGDTIDRAELATQAGMSPTSSSTDQHLSTLRRNGLADGHMGAWRASRMLFLEPAGRV